jgi:hypothetical protein
VTRALKVRSDRYSPADPGMKAVRFVRWAQREVSAASRAFMIWRTRSRADARGRVEPLLAKLDSGPRSSLIGFAPLLGEADVAVAVSQDAVYESGDRGDRTFRPVVSPR